MEIALEKTELLKIDNEKVIEQLKRMIITNNKCRSFNVMIDSKIEPVILTGQEDEREIPTFMGLVTFEYENKTFVAVDARQVAKFKSGEEDIMKLATNPDALFILLIRLILTVEATDNVNSIKPLLKPLANASISWVVKMLNNKLMMSPQEILIVETVIAYYFFATFSLVEDEHLFTEQTVNHLGKDYKRTIIDILEKCGKPTNIIELIESIHKAGAKFTSINIPVLMSVLGTSVFVPGGQMAVIAGLENPIFALSNIFSAITQKINSKSRMRMILSRDKNVIEIIDGMKHIQLKLIKL